MGSMNRLIVADNLVKRYDKANILNGASLSADTGDFIIIHGKSGCGKTTLLNIMGGLDRPSSGTVWIGGVNIVDLPESELAGFRLANIGFVFQDYNLLPELTVRENVALPTRLAGREDDKHVDNLLREFGIEHIAEEISAKISGGEAQRTATARALANRPKIVLADEPTGSLDRENSDSVIEMLHLARDTSRTTVIIATHEHDLATPGRRMLLNDGRIDVCA